MKKLLAPAILLAITVSLLSSCNGPSNMALTKRHYRSGYYVDWRTRKNVIKAPVVSVIAAKAEPTPAAIKIASPEVYAVPSTSIRVVEKSKIAQTKNYKHSKALAHPTAIPELASPKTTMVNNTAPDYIQNVADHNVQVNVNVSFVLIVLCAIFIPPLGVALMYGIHSYFWIDLILTLIFFIPGMIFALIVVLM
jgi:uncharacterized membrane protein YqaE (UPF0057 family)